MDGELRTTLRELQDLKDNKGVLKQQANAQAFMFGIGSTHSGIDWQKWKDWLRANLKGKIVNHAVIGDITPTWQGLLHGLSTRNINSPKRLEIFKQLYTSLSRAKVEYIGAPRKKPKNKDVDKLCELVDIVNVKGKLYHVRHIIFHDKNKGHYYYDHSIYTPITEEAPPGNLGHHIGACQRTLTRNDASSHSPRNIYTTNARRSSGR